MSTPQPALIILWYFQFKERMQILMKDKNEFWYFCKLNQKSVKNYIFHDFAKIILVSKKNYLIRITSLLLIHTDMHSNKRENTTRLTDCKTFASALNTQKGVIWMRNLPIKFKHAKFLFCCCECCKRINILQITLECC